MVLRVIRIYGYLYVSISLKSIRERRRIIGAGLHWYIENIVRFRQHTYCTLSASYIISQYIIFNAYCTY